LSSRNAFQSERSRDVESIFPSNGLPIVIPVLLSDGQQIAREGDRPPRMVTTAQPRGRQPAITSVLLFGRCCLQDGW